MADSRLTFIFSSRLQAWLNDPNCERLLYDDFFPERPTSDDVKGFELSYDVLMVLTPCDPLFIASVPKQNITLVVSSCQHNINT